MPKRYIVGLTEEEQQYLQDLVSKGKAAAYKIKHANILLNVDVNGQGWTDEEAATALSCHRNTVANLRQRLVEVLEIYHVPYDPKRPVICIDEPPVQLVKETRVTACET
jgi:hypothetical protein